jgi:hypothetical protein
MIAEQPLIKASTSGPSLQPPPSSACAGTGSVSSVAMRFADPDPSWHFRRASSAGRLPSSETNNRPLRKLSSFPPWIADTQSGVNSNRIESAVLAASIVHS